MMRGENKKRNLKWGIIIGLILFFVLLFVKVQFSKNKEQITEIWLWDHGTSSIYVTLICREDVRVPDELKTSPADSDISEGEKELMEIFDGYETEKGYRVLTEYILNKSSYTNSDNIIYTGFLTDNDFRVLIYISSSDAYELLLTYPISYYQDKGAYANLFEGSRFEIDIDEYAGYKGMDYDLVAGRTNIYKEYPDREGYIVSMGVFYFIIAGVLYVVRSVICTGLQIMPIFYYAKRNDINIAKERKKYIFICSIIFQLLMNFIISELLGMGARLFILFLPIVFILALISEISAFNYNLYCEKFKGLKMLVMTGYVILSNLILLFAAYFLAYLCMPFGYLL